MADPKESVTVASHGPEQTEGLAAALAAGLPPSTVVGLIGPLGAGKTCFARGLAGGLGVDPRLVTSPTFVYLVDYSGRDGLVINHADLYRLADLGIAESASAATRDALESIGLHEAVAGDGITIVEWWEHYAGPLPERVIRVEFAIENVDDRSITLEFAGAGLADAARLAQRYASESIDT